MIASLKIGYRMKMLDILLNVCESKDSYEKAISVGNELGRGCKGIYNASKANVLDALQILKSLWDGDKKYCKVDGIKSCWRKTGTLPVLMQVDLINDVGSATRSQVLTEEGKVVLNELSSLFRNLTMKANEFTKDGKALPSAFENSIVSDMKEPSKEELNEMMQKWSDIENDEEIQKDDIEEYIEIIESAGKDNEIEECNEEASSDDIEFDSLRLSPSSDISWTEALEALQKVRKYIYQEDLGGETEMQLDKLSYVLQKSSISKRIGQNTCQDSITKYFK